VATVDESLYGTYFAQNPDTSIVKDPEPEPEPRAKPKPRAKATTPKGNKSPMKTPATKKKAAKK
jgi:hypothetical protein